MAKGKLYIPSFNKLEREAEVKNNSIEQNRKRRSEIKPKLLAAIKNAIDEKKLTLTISILDIKEHPLSELNDVSNPILLIFRNGSFEVIPSGIDSHEIKKYIGVRSLRITHWAALPLPSIHHPTTSRAYFNYKDIYER